MLGAILALSLATGPVAEALTTDRIVYDVLKDLNNRGADLNNAGDPVGCYRVYEGGLLVVRAMLGHRPTIQKQIDDATQAAEQRPVIERAVAYHRLITEIRAVLKPGVVQLHNPTLVTPPSNAEVPKATPEPKDPPKPVLPGAGPSSFPASPPQKPAAVTATLWDRLGGEKSIEKAMGDALVAALADAKIDLTRGGLFRLEGESMDACRRRLVGYVSNLTEGTVPTGVKSIAECHAGMPTTDEPLNLFLGHVRKALTDAGRSPADVEELIKKVQAAR